MCVQIFEIMDHTKSQPIIIPIARSPKFVRRSMSPIDYINTNQYKARLKRKQIQVAFPPVANTKLEKVSRKKRENALGTSATQFARELALVDRQLASNISENSFLKTSNHTECEDKSSRKLNNDSNNENDFLKVLDEDSYITRAESHVHQQLEAARKKILELEADLVAKDAIIRQQAQQIETAWKKCEDSNNCAVMYKCGWEKSKIKLTMERRKSAQYLMDINELHETNRKKTNLLDRLMEKQKKLTRLKQQRQWFFELSPEKGER